MLYLGISLVVSEEGFYQQTNGSIMKLEMTGLTITRVVLRNKRVVVIVVRIHKKVFQSVVFDFMTIAFRRGMVLASNNSNMYNAYYSVC